jgi:prevent-host-death family protein
MFRRSKKPIQEVAISEFKAKYLSLLEEVSKTKIPLRVTRRGKPVADVVPSVKVANERDWIGSMSGEIEFTGDITSPVIEIREIEAGTLSLVLVTADDRFLGLGQIATLANR